MRPLLRLSFAIDRCSRAVGRAMAWLIVIMAVLGAYNAIARYVERGVGERLSSNAFLELQWYLFSLAFLFGAPYALRRGAHVRVDVLYGRLSPRGRAWIDLLGSVFLLLPFCLFAVWISRDFVLDSVRVREQSLDPGGLPRWPLKAVVPVAFLLLALQGVSEIIKLVLFLRGAGADEVGLRESDDGAPNPSRTEAT